MNHYMNIEHSQALQAVNPQAEKRPRHTTNHIYVVPICGAREALNNLELLRYLQHQGL